MKPLNTTPETVQALLKGATKFIIPLSNTAAVNLTFEQGEYCASEIKGLLKEIVNHYSTLQIEDEFYLQEEFQDMLGEIHYGKTLASHHSKFIDASKMTPEQSRYKGKIAKVEVKRVQEINDDTNQIMGLYGIEDVVFDEDDRYEQIATFKYWYNTQYPEQPYEQNPYVFIYTIEG